MPTDDGQIDHLVAEYNRLANEHDFHADGVVREAMRVGWNGQLTDRFWDLKHQAATHRVLAQEVQDLRP